jgi:hypothetical protein
MIRLLREYIKATCLLEAARPKTEHAPALVARAEKLTQAIPEVDGWDRAVTRYMPVRVDPKQAAAMLKALQALEDKGFMADEITSAVANHTRAIPYAGGT